MIDKAREIKKSFNNVEASIKASTSWSVCYIHHSVYYNKKIEKSFSNFLSYQNCLLSPMIHQFTLDSFMRKSSVNLKLHSVELTEVRFWLLHTLMILTLWYFCWIHSRLCLTKMWETWELWAGNKSQDYL